MNKSIVPSKKSTIPGTAGGYKKHWQSVLKRQCMGLLYIYLEPFWSFFSLDGKPSCKTHQNIAKTGLKGFSFSFSIR